MTLHDHDEIERTRIIVNSWRDDVRICLNAFGTSSKAVTAATDIRSVLERLVETVQALDTLEEHVGELRKKARSYLASTMEHVGAYSIKADGVAAVLADAVRQPIVTHVSMIPSEYWTKPEPKPDMTLIGKNLRAGEIIAGVSLSNGGAPVLKLTRSANKEKVAA